ncbi:MAG: hypothetical protein LBU39_07925 [Desulfobulbaceae bacterium]|nr:hypothetical protein [Desulfobulbaceae bacterium]
MVNASAPFAQSGEMPAKENRASELISNCGTQNFPLSRNRRKKALIGHDISWRGAGKIRINTVISIAFSKPPAGEKILYADAAADGLWPL